MTIAVLTGLLLVWLLVVRVPPPTAAPAKPVVVRAPPPAVTVAPPVAEPVAPKPAEVPSKPPVATETRPTEPPNPAAPPAAEQHAEDANADDTADENGTDSESEDSGPPDIDTDHATDLLADLIAREESATDGDHLPNAVTQTLKKFDQESADANWSESAEQHIEATLDEWIGALPQDDQAHFALIHVECRATLCQVLAADNDPDGADARAKDGHEWQQALASLGNQPWWEQLGFVDMNTQVSSADNHALYMSYLMRRSQSQPVPDAPSDTGDGGNPDGG
jgi:hypothetical protein